MNVNDPKWFRSMGAEKLMEAEEREKKEREEKNKLPFELPCQPHEISGTEAMIKSIVRQSELEELKAVANNHISVVIHKLTGKKMILVGFVNEENKNFGITVDKDGNLFACAINEIKFLLPNNQKKLLEED